MGTLIVLVAGWLQGENTLICWLHKYQALTTLIVDWVLMQAVVIGCYAWDDATSALLMLTNIWLAPVDNGNDCFQRT